MSIERLLRRDIIGKTFLFEDDLMGTAQKKDEANINIEMIAGLRVLNEDGEKVTLSPLWKDHSLVLIFIRQFSCIACRAHVDQIWKKRAEFEKSKTKIIFVGTGAPYMIKMFKEDLGINEAIIYTDPTLKFFDACGFKRNALRLMDPRGVAKIKGFIDVGHKQGKYSNDSGSYTQLGGILAFKPPGKIVYHFVSDYVGDFDDPSEWHKE